MIKKKPDLIKLIQKKNHEFKLKQKISYKGILAGTVAIGFQFFSSMLLKMTFKTDQSLKGIIILCWCFDDLISKHFVLRGQKK
jgi:hypothetical protein